MTNALDASVVIGDGHFRLVFDSSPVGMAIVALDGSWVDVNDALCRLTGYARGDLLRRDFQSITHPDDLAPDLEQVRRLLAEEIDGYQMRKRYLRPSGEPVWVLLAVSLVHDEEGTPQYFVVQVVDIDAQVRAEAALESQTRLFTLSFEGSLVAMAVGDADGNLLEVNQAFAELVGRPREELIGLHHDVITHPEDRGLGAVHAQRTEEDPSRPAVFEKRFLRPDGQAVWVELSMTSVRSADGQSRRLVHVEDIGARRSRRLAEERERAWLDQLVAVQREVTVLATDRQAALERIVAAALDLVEHAEGAAVELPAPDDPGRLVYVGAVGSTAGFLGLSVDRHRSMSGLAMRTTRLQRCDDSETDERVDREACRRTGVGSMLVAPLLAGDRAVGVLKVTSASPWRFDEHDEQLLSTLAHALAGALQLADDHVRLTEASRIATERARLIELASDAVMVRDMDDRVRYWNTAAEQLYGWSAADVEGCNLERLLGTRNPEGQSREQIRHELLAHDRWEGELEQLTADGRQVVVRCRKAVQRDDQGRPVSILTINTDVTDRRRAERALAASEELFRSQYEHSGVGLGIRGTDDVLQSVNPALARMLGYDDPADLVGLHARSLISEEAQGRRRAALASVYAGETDSISYETRLRRRDGSEIEVDFTSSALRDEHGRPVRFVSIVQDISERKQAERARDAAMAELEQQNEQLAAADRLKTDLIGMLGHEINNPLSVLVAALDALGPDSPVQHPGSGGLDFPTLLPVLRRSAGRIGETVREILALVTADAGRLTDSPRPVPLAAALRELLEGSGTGAGLVCPEEARALVQPEHLDQVLTNLLTNAAKYAGGATSVGVELLADRVEIAVVDHGPGVPASFASHLFERFARAEETADRARGTGLGLYLSRELARANGGELDHRQTPGGGSTFVLSLPRP